MVEEIQDVRVQIGLWRSIVLGFGFGLGFLLVQLALGLILTLVALALLSAYSDRLLGSP